ncbi:MAG: ribosome maturation factor RimM [Thermoanaerobaculia bacterium]
MASGEMPDLVLVGRIRRPHGVRGEVVVEALSDNPERFVRGADLIGRSADGAVEALTIAAVRPHSGALLVLFEGLADRDEMARLRGADLLVAASEVGEAPEGSYYYFELIGCACFDRAAGALGKVVSVREDGGGLILEIRDETRTVLVPFVSEYLTSVEVERKRIDLDLPAGLLETCASAS